MARRRVYTRQPHLWRRAGGVFYIVWNQDSQTKKRSTYTRDRAVADAVLLQFMEGFDRHGKTTPGVTFRDGIAEWLADRCRPRQNLNPRTIGEYERWARLFSDSFPKKLLAKDVTPRLIRTFLDSQEDRGLSPTTLRKFLVGLSMVFRFLMREGLVQVNPCENLSVKANPNRHPAMTGEEYHLLLSTLDQDIEAAVSSKQRRDNEEIRDLAVVLWWSGLRFVEAIRMAWKDIDLGAKSWTIRSPENKGGNTTLPIHPELIPLLGRRLLLGMEGPFSDYWAIGRRWRQFKMKHGQFKGWSWHRMRHAFVTRLRRAGKEASAMALARHKTPSMSDHYTHLTETDLRRDLEDL